ncbi:ATP-dependent zinc protease [Marinobacter sp. JSM 1782161]|uniref:ATP-dependent zinc protease family protein n=1 Tax=Marinobacter sp. JSM 1782161 TaxID=2685906 RepID=UPI0014021EB2|nr:RimK/LysX family protein [Marinobacter sp. JSM 1782161]
MKTGLSLILAALLSAFTPLASADDDTDYETLGFVEWVVLQDSGVRLKARLDTGAKTSSLHAVNVEPFERDGEDWVSFELPLDDHKDSDDAEDTHVVLQFERPVERTVLIKRKGAESQRRYVVNMDFCIAGKTHETQFSLTDRGRFHYGVLLGRRFMAPDNVLVSSSDSFEAGEECSYQTLEELAQERDGD